MLSVLSRQIKAVNAGRWLGADAEQLVIRTKTSRRYAPGGTGGLTRPATNTARHSSAVQRPHRSSSACQLQGPASRFNVRHLPGGCVLRRREMCGSHSATREVLERHQSNSKFPVCSGGDLPEQHKAAVRTAARVLVSFV